MKRSLIILFLLLTTSLSAQEWEPRSFDSLETPDEYTFTADSDIMENSRGWFPAPMFSEFTFGLIFGGGPTYENANNIMPGGIVRTNLPYSNRYDEKDNYLELRKTFSDEDEGNSVDDGLAMVGLEFHYTPNWRIPLVFRTIIRSSWESGNLYSLDRTKEYIDFDGNVNNFLEIGHLIVDEWMIDITPGIIIPLYGIFIGESVNMTNIYYLSLGANFSFVNSSDVSQFLQIADVKHELRYENGRDTLNLVNPTGSPDFNTLRLNGEIGLGMLFKVRGIGYNLETVFRFPTESILNDVMWRRYSVEFRLSLIFGGLF